MTTASGDDKPDDPEIVVAGRRIARPSQQIITYIRCLPKTVRSYDLASAGNPDAVSAGEVARTRIIRSRISNQQRDWFMARAAEREDLWQAVPPDARLADADPDVHGGLYDRADALFNLFLMPRQSGVWVGKVSKVLHLKRPHLYPILDSRLMAAYRRLAADAAQRYQQQRPGQRRMYWAAIRDDLTSPAGIAALAVVRRRLSEHADDLINQAASLSDVRLLDILTWQPSTPPAT